MRASGIIKVLSLNSLSLGFSFTEVELLFRLGIIFISIVYTTVKLIKEIKDK